MGAARKPTHVFSLKIAMTVVCVSRVNALTHAMEMLIAPARKPAERGSVNPLNFAKEISTAREENYAIEVNAPPPASVTFNAIFDSSAMWPVVVAHRPQTAKRMPTVQRRSSAV